MPDDKKKGGIREFTASFGNTEGDQPQMPLRVVVLGEFSPRDLRTGRSAEHRRRHAIDKDSFNGVMGALDMRLFVDVPDRLGSSREPLIAELPLTDLKSFGPDAVAAALPSTAELLKLREALAAHQSGKVSLDEIRSLLEGMTSRSAVAESLLRALVKPEEAEGAREKTIPASGPSPGGGGVDAILDLVEAPRGEASRGADLARLEGLVRHLVRSVGRAERADSRVVDGMLAEIDAALSLQVDEILHHPEFRRLEAAWRGLKFLVDRTEFREPIRLEIISTPRESLLSVYDEIVHGPESQAVSSEPLGLVIASFRFGPLPEDVDLLRALAERGASLSVPILADADPSLLGLDSASDLASKESLGDIYSGPDFAKWKGLREYGPSRWLGLVFNRFLLRGAYEPGSRGARLFGYAESQAGPADGHFLWGDGSWAVGCLVTRSFARTGWCTDIMGQRPSGTIEDLSLRSLVRPGGTKVSYPLETVISDQIERDLSNNGLMALTAALNADRVHLRYAATVHAPRHYQEPTDRARARLQSTLPFQFFVGRLVNYAMMVEPSLVPGRGAEEICADYDKALRGLMATASPVPEDAVKVAVLPNESDASRQDLYLKVRWPGFQSLPEAGEIELRWPLG